MAPSMTATAATRSAGLLLNADDVVVHYWFRSSHQSLRDRFTRRAKQSPFQVIEAVKGVSLEIREGEVIGVVGANGSGKSSLLRALAGLQPVVSGQVLAVEQPVLLGVASVLKPALSGRRNIWLGCLALGLSRAQVRSLEDEIIAFSGLESAIDRPIRTYSSGMRARLHFSIATSVQPRILLLDETLSVGDESFRRRSAERLEQLRENAGAVVMVSHSLAEVERGATRVLWLHDGEVQLEGDPATVVAAYRSGDLQPEPQ